MDEDLQTLLLKRNEFKKLAKNNNANLNALIRDSDNYYNHMRDAEFDEKEDIMREWEKRLTGCEQEIEQTNFLLELNMSLYFVYNKKIKEKMLGEIGVKIFELEYGKDKIENTIKNLIFISAEIEPFKKIVSTLINNEYFNYTVLDDAEERGRKKKVLKTGVINAIKLLYNAGEISDTSPNNDIFFKVRTFLRDNGYTSFKASTVIDYIKKNRNNILKKEKVTSHSRSLKIS